jgi:hypothetical protein
MTTPLSLGFASAYQKIEDSLPHTRFGISPVIRTGINDLARGGETAFSQAYADDQMARYMGKVKSEGLANSQYLLGISPHRLVAPAKYVAPIFGEGQAYGLHGGAIDKQTQPMIAKMWANKANQLRALATPLDVGAPAFLPSESEVSFNSEIRTEKENEKYKTLVDTFDLVSVIFETKDIVGNKLLLNLTSIFNLLKEVGWSMNQFEVNEFVETASSWISPRAWEDLLESLRVDIGALRPIAGEGPSAVSKRIDQEQKISNRAQLIYQYISAILDILLFVKDQIDMKKDPQEIKRLIKFKVADVRKGLAKGKYITPDDFGMIQARPRGGPSRASNASMDSLASPDLSTLDMGPSTRSSRRSSMAIPNSRGVSGVSTPMGSIMSELISRPNTLSVRSGLETPLSSVGGLEARRVARDINELLNARL